MRRSLLPFVLDEVCPYGTSDRSACGTQHASSCSMAGPASCRATYEGCTEPAILLPTRTLSILSLPSLWRISALLSAVAALIIAALVWRIARLPALVLAVPALLRRPAVLVLPVVALMLDQLPSLHEARPRDAPVAAGIAGDHHTGLVHNLAADLGCSPAVVLDCTLEAVPGCTHAVADCSSDHILLAVDNPHLHRRLRNNPDSTSRSFETGQEELEIERNTGVRRGEENDRAAEGTLLSCKAHGSAAVAGQ